MEKKSRRFFLRLAIVGIVSLFGFLWNKLTLTHIEQMKKNGRVFPFNKNKPVAFFENYIVINQQETTTVYSAHCTHLGCIVNKTENSRLVCPCHGSEYDFLGKVVKGPAYKDLEIIPAKIMADGTQIEIEG